MNSSKQKADELIEKFYEAACQMNFNESRGWFIDEEQSRTNATQCAIIAVEEIINEFPQGYKGNFEEKRKEYWKDVLNYLKNKL